MKKIFLYLIAVAAAIMAVACVQYETPKNKPKPGTEEPGGETTPVRKVYNVVAHRGGYVESGLPDCSIAGLKYSIALGCKYSECDIVITKDNEILVIHPYTAPGIGDAVNGVAPSEYTAAEIRAKGKLKNGEEIPTLREYIAFLQDEKNNPIGHTVWMDVKAITLRGQNRYDLSRNACLRAAQIVKEMKAENIMEFIVPDGGGVYEDCCEQIINTYKMNIAWMAAVQPSLYKGGWAQLRWDKCIGEGKQINPQSFFDAGVPLSMYYTVGDIAENDRIEELVVPYYPKLKAIFTNYPKRLVDRLKKLGY